MHDSYLKAYMKTIVRSIIMVLVCTQEVHTIQNSVPIYDDSQTPEEFVKNLHQQGYTVHDSIKAHIHHKKQMAKKQLSQQAGFTTSDWLHIKITMLEMVKKSRQKTSLVLFHDYIPLQIAQYIQRAAERLAINIPINVYVTNSHKRSCAATVSLSDDLQQHTLTLTRDLFIGKEFWDCGNIPNLSHNEIIAILEHEFVHLQKNHYAKRIVINRLLIQKHGNINKNIQKALDKFDKSQEYESNLLPASNNIEIAYTLLQQQQLQCKKRYRDTLHPNPCKQANQLTTIITLLEAEQQLFATPVNP
jgi:hypothetical protein